MVPSRPDCIPPGCFIRVRRDCSLVLQPGPRFGGDLPGVLASDSGGVLASGSIGVTLVFAIESTQVGLIQQMTDTRHMLMNRRSLDGKIQLLCNNNGISAVLNCITSDKPRNVLKKTLSESAATPPKKRARMDSVAEEQYLFDDLAFLIFEVSLSESVTVHLFKVGALSRRNGDLYRCDFDIDIDGKFVLGSLPEATKNVLSDYCAHIRMSECTLVTNIQHPRVEFVGGTVVHRLDQTGVVAEE